MASAVGLGTSGLATSGLGQAATLGLAAVESSLVRTTATKLSTGKTHAPALTVSAKFSVSGAGGRIPYLRWFIILWAMTNPVFDTFKSPEKGAPNNRTR